MTDDNGDSLQITREELTEIVQAAAHQAAKSVNLSAQLTSINDRLNALEGQNRAFSQALSDHMKEETEEMRRAVSEGIADGLSQVNLADKSARNDVRELRDLLSAWRDVKGALWARLKNIIAVAILGSIAWVVTVLTSFNPFNTQ